VTYASVSLSLTVRGGSEALAKSAQSAAAEDSGPGDSGPGGPGRARPWDSNAGASTFDAADPWRRGRAVSSWPRGVAESGRIQRADSNMQVQNGGATTGLDSARRTQRHTGQRVDHRATVLRILSRQFQGSPSPCSSLSAANPVTERFNPSTGSSEEYSEGSFGPTRAGHCSVRGAMALRGACSTLVSCKLSRTAGSDWGRFRGAAGPCGVLTGLAAHADA
jgi:hypothetical protein